MKLLNVTDLEMFHRIAMLCCIDVLIGCIRCCIVEKGRF